MAGCCLCAKPWPSNPGSLPYRFDNRVEMTYSLVTKSKMQGAWRTAIGLTRGASGGAVCLSPPSIEVQGHTNPNGNRNGSTDRH